MSGFDIQHSLNPLLVLCCIYLRCDLLALQIQELLSSGILPKVLFTPIKKGLLSNPQASALECVFQVQQLDQQRARPGFGHAHQEPQGDLPSFASYPGPPSRPWDRHKADVNPAEQSQRHYSADVFQRQWSQPTDAERIHKAQFKEYTSQSSTNHRSGYRSQFSPSIPLPLTPQPPTSHTHLSPPSASPPPLLFLGIAS